MTLERDTPPLHNAIILFIVSLVLSLTMGLILFFYSVIKCVFFKKHSLARLLTDTAVSLDQTDNVLTQHFMNDFLINKTDNPELLFGNMDETISSNIGENEKKGNLTKIGIFINKILNFIDPNHSINAIEEDEI